MAFRSPLARNEKDSSSLSGLLVLFFLSGVAALVYQVCWQRMLFAALGTDLESITIIVSTFMVGLGMGAILGGIVGDRFPGRAIRLFCLVELVIGAFGVASPWLIAFVAQGIPVANHGVLALLCFLLLVIPTSMMGATLPLLVKHFFSTNRSIGVSVGQLYFANTIGAALGAFLCGFVLFYFVGLVGAVRFAAILNAGVALAALALSKKMPSESGMANDGDAAPSALPPVVSTGSHQGAL